MVSQIPSWRVHLVHNLLTFPETRRKACRRRWTTPQRLGIAFYGKLVNNYSGWKTVKTVLKCAACLGVLLASQMTRGQSCRPLEQKVFYQYDASHRIYPESAVVLETKHAPGGLSILISVARRIGGQWQQRILQSKDMGRHWVQVGAQDIPTPLALSGSNFAQAPSDPRVQYKYIERKKTYDRS